MPLIKCVLQRRHNTPVWAAGKHESRVLQDWIKVSLFPFHSFRCRFVPVELSCDKLFTVGKGLTLVLMK